MHAFRQHVAKHERHSRKSKMALHVISEGVGYFCSCSATRSSNHGRQRYQTKHGINHSITYDTMWRVVRGTVVYSQLHIRNCWNQQEHFVRCSKAFRTGIPLQPKSFHHSYFIYNLVGSHEESTNVYFYTKFRKYSPSLAIYAALLAANRTEKNGQIQFKLSFVLKQLTQV